MREPFYSNQSLIVVAIVDGTACSLLQPRNGHYLVLSSSTNDWLVRYYVERYSDGTVSGELLVGRIAYYWGSAPGANRIVNSGYVTVYYLICE